MRPLFGLGVDTSAYTTSLCLADAAGQVLWECRRPLPVPSGAIGLRQSRAFFLHVHALGEMSEVWRREAGHWRVGGVVASERPRPIVGSYMPVFTAGSHWGRTLAAAWGVPYAGISHQENHIWAALSTAPIWFRRSLPSGGPFLVLHVSGGTTDLLLVRGGEGDEVSPPRDLEIERWGGSDDLTAGQMIDRIGVALGLGFPAGPALEGLAGETIPPNLRLPVSVGERRLSFSGPESAAQRALAAGASPAELAAAVFLCIAASLTRLLDQAARACAPRALVCVGGVIANAALQRSMLEWGAARGIEVHVAPAERSRDNAAGCAWVAAHLA